MAARNYAEMAAISRIERLHFAALFATEDQKLGMESFVASGPGKATFTGT